eukprot:scaffold72031_cov36-Phaeocystis_antarctica.AAC.2
MAMLMRMATTKKGDVADGGADAAPAAGAARDDHVLLWELCAEGLAARGALEAEDLSLRHPQRATRDGVALSAVAVTKLCRRRYQRNPSSNKIAPALSAVMSSGGV